MAGRRPAFRTEVASGDRRRALEALRDRLAVELERAEGAAVAPLAKQLRDVVADLDGIKVPEASKRDELAKRRAARRAAAQIPGDSTEGVDGGGGSGRAGGERGPGP